MKAMVFLRNLSMVAVAMMVFAAAGLCQAVDPAQKGAKTNGKAVRDKDPKAIPLPAPTSTETPVGLGASAGIRTSPRPTSC